MAAAAKVKFGRHVRPAPENLVRPLRIVRGMSQQTVGIRAGCSQFFIGQVERGARIPTAGMKARIADALGVDVADIFFSSKKVKASRARRG